MKPWMQKLARFLMGRNGPDSLYTAILVVELILMVVNLFVGSWILNLLIWALLFWGIFRVFSRNLPARRRENEIWLKIWKKITFGKGPVRGSNPFGRQGGYGSYGGYGGYGGYGQGYTPPPPPQKKKKLKTDRDHCFRICPQCRANIRLPKKRGKHTVVCPRCKCRFEVSI